ncbi:hypothetical protein DCC79_01870 [bacterium]|nr:MAG: hypothetical protein DCC79_01870 [bacterium]
MGALMWAGTFVLAIVAVVFPDTAFSWIAGALAVCSVVVLACSHFMYRPPENCFGVVFRPADRRYRIVGRNAWTVVLPGVERKREPVDARMAVIKTHHPNVLTADGRVIEIAVDWAYHLDPRTVRTDFLLQFMEISEKGMWQMVISRRLNDLVGSVVLRHRYASLLEDAGRAALKRDLGVEAEALLRRFGLRHEAETGVILQFAQPPARVRRAKEDRAAAWEDGPAARDRVGDLVDLLDSRERSAAELWYLRSTEHVARPPAPPTTMIPLADAGRTDGVLPISAPPPFGPTGDDHPDAPRPAA